MGTRGRFTRRSRALPFLRSRDARHSRVGRPDYIRTNNWQRRPSTVYDRAGWHPARRIPSTLQQCSIAASCRDMISGEPNRSSRFMQSHERRDRKAANGRSSICELHTSHIKWEELLEREGKNREKDLSPTLSVRYFDPAIHSGRSPASHC
jgi:hypothetical protein